MHHTRVKLCAALLVAGAIVAGCNSDRATGANSAAPALKRMRAPAPPPPDGGPAPAKPETVTVATRRVPLVYDIVRAKLIDSRGGTLEIREAGFKLVVPPKAVASATLFTVTALKGTLIAYEFGPEGSRFDGVPLRVEQDMKEIWMPEDEDAAAGYFESRDQLDDENTVGVLGEPLIQATRDGTVDKILFDVYHFSGYLVASGRKRTLSSY